MDIKRNEMEMQRLANENSRLAQEAANMRTQAYSQQSGMASGNGMGRMEEEYLNIRSRISELESRHSIVDQDTARLSMKSKSFNSKVCVAVVVEDPQVELLRRELKGLIAQNRSLVESLKHFRVSQC